MNVPLLGALQKCDFISFILGRRESKTTCFFEPHGLAALPSINERDKKMSAGQALILVHRLENVSGCVFVLFPSPIFKRDGFLLPSFMLRSGEPVLH